ncbi:MAG: M48 family metalloprotease [Hyphomonadaceae bacterium]
MRRLLAIAAAAALAFTPSLAAAQRARPAPETAEGGLWRAADEVERDARRSGERINDPALEAYVREVMCRVASESCDDIRLYLMQRPFFNASMAPNGYSEVWSGMLLRIEDEAQLAFVLGHETVHYTERHSLAAQTAIRNRANAALALSVGLAVAGAAAAVNNPYSAQSIMDLTGSLVDIVYLASIASFFAYTRESEEEADALGHQRAVAAGYDGAAGAGIWESLIDETAHSDFERTRRREARANIFATHPLSRDRVEALRARAQTAQQVGDRGRERYRAAIRPHLDAWLRDELRRRDYGQTLTLLARLEAGGDAGVASFYRGEVYRLRRGEGDMALAQGAYETAITQSDAPPAAYRQLGELYVRQNRSEEAAALLQTYLDRAPEAQDRALVERQVRTIRGE